MKKAALFLIVIGLMIGVLAGCSTNDGPNANPKNTVEGFLTAIQKGEYEKADTFLEDSKNKFKLDGMDETLGDVKGKEIIDAMMKQYKFENVTELSKKDNEAEVKVKITSVDFAAALGKTTGDLMATVMADAMSGGKQPSEKDMQEKVMKELLKNLNDKNAKTITREVTLTLKKDKEGNFKVVSNDQLEEAMIANGKELSTMFKKMKN